MRTLISFSEALTIVLDQAVLLDTQKISLDDALWRTLATQITSTENIPPFASSAMDGFAIRSADLVDSGTSLDIIEHISAGHVPEKEIVQGTCARIMTGAPVPRGADAIAPLEWANESTGRVSFSAVPPRGKHIRPPAEDVRIGDMVFESGQEITPPVVGMLATLGVSEVEVRRSPVVAIISTGDEIVSPERTPDPGQIRNSNGPSLRAQVLAAGGICASYEHAADDPESIRTAINRNLHADIMIFSGGVSVGQHDYVKSVLDEVGNEMLFWKVKQRPGKPLAFGKLGNTLVLGLPGNPVSSAMCFAIYARPLIEKLLGRKEVGNVRLNAVIESRMKKAKGFHYFSRGFVRVDESGSLCVSQAGPQGSNLYGSVVRANCIIHLPAESEIINAGDPVVIELLPWANLIPA